MIKPKKLQPGDTIATASPSWGCAGDDNIRWKYELGVKRLKELGLNVTAAPNSLKGAEYLDKHPEARAEDLMWAFENKSVNGIIANIGGNDSVRLLPYLDSKVIQANPKIFCGYSDIMTLHLYLNRRGLCTFYGDNLLTTVAEAEMWHPYSKYWFEKVFFDSSPIGVISPSSDWSYSENDHIDPNYRKTYIKNPGYAKIQGEGCARGKLFGGHGGLIEFAADSGISLCASDFKDTILFFEDIPEFFTPEYIENFFDYLGKNGYLQLLSGVIIGKTHNCGDFEPYANTIRKVVSGKYGAVKLPIISGLNFGHTSPICVLPYGALAEIDADELRFEILENGVTD